MPLKYLIPLGVGLTLLLIFIFIVWPRLGTTIVISSLGFLMVWKTSWVLEMFGRSPWAEEHLQGGFGAGAGGSWLWYKLIGILAIVGSILYLTGLLQTILTGVLGPFFGGGGQGF